VKWFIKDEWSNEVEETRTNGYVLPGGHIGVKDTPKSVEEKRKKNNCLPFVKGQ